MECHRISDSAVRFRAETDSRRRLRRVPKAICLFFVLGLLLNAGRAVQAQKPPAPSQSGHHALVDSSKPSREGVGAANPEPTPDQGAISARPQLLPLRSGTQSADLDGRSGAPTSMKNRAAGDPSTQDDIGARAQPEARELERRAAESRPEKITQWALPNLVYLAAAILLGIGSAALRLRMWFRSYWGLGLFDNWSTWTYVGSVAVLSFFAFLCTENVSAMLQGLLTTKGGVSAHAVRKLDQSAARKVIHLRAVHSTLF